ncbi:M56 family metallopeptidase [Flavobacterium sp.]|uniref:M56 family metallopeptidase n=1 Tax=Flavobacterium sp. TaxID=239 RepID=UPI0008B09898|nr:M56 family metallopeptidase [Flavobacterium sp.]OGS61929.1 MAG: hypothetical protein A2X07_04195 [Flavobacteria bacterium GWF1_32_7]HBD26642.1 hypothetical protein [Flavobacterium sp.]
MENLLIYFLKVNGLIVLFYLMYVLFLRKETFFNSNRWYFLIGLVLSLILPLVKFTKTIWIEATPVSEVNEVSIPLTYSQVEIPVQETIDWSLFLMSAYIVISILIILKIGMELVSFFRRIQKQNKQKESDYTLVDSNSAENPFSFFSYIVINKDMFTEEELQHILTHESIHVKQKHSFDVLIGKIFCALFWANPIIWFYRKAMLQNLEFIADNETFQQIENKYEYQKTLLKVVTHQHDLSITNQFYQSLIKKRIVMLHTNQSHKKNVWKYATILPLLVGFMLLFQIETVAQIKEVTISKSITDKLIQFVIDKNTTDAQIKEETELLKKEYNIDLKISKIKRNAKNEITALEAKFEDSDETSGKISIKGEEAIEPIRFFKEINENGKGNIGFDRNNISTVFAKMDPDQLEWNDAKTIEIKKSDTDEVIYIINGKEYSKEQMKDKIVELDGAIEMNEDDKTGKKTMIFKGNSTISDEPKTIIYLDEKVISEDEMKKIDANIIKSVDVSKGNIKKEIKIITKNSSGLPEDAEIYINGKKATKEELDKIEKENIETININNNNGKKTIEIQKRNIKTISGGTWTDVNKEIKKQEIKTITTDDGDESIIFNVNKLKIPGEPTVIIENGKVDIYVNGKKLPNSESFLNIDPSKIYYLEVTDKEKTNEGITKIKRIEVKTK